MIFADVNMRNVVGTTFDRNCRAFFLDIGMMGIVKKFTIRMCDLADKGMCISHGIEKITLKTIQRLDGQAYIMTSRKFSGLAQYFNTPAILIRCWCHSSK